jgi:hypothetical protein
VSPNPTTTTGQLPLVDRDAHGGNNAKNAKSSLNFVISLELSSFQNFCC